MGMEKENQKSSPLTPKSRKFLKLVVLCLAVLYAVAGLTIPYLFETQTLWYKVGIDKTLLRCGQLVGIMALVLIFYQVLVGARGEFLEQLFGVSTLMRFHHITGVLIALLIVAHGLLVLLPEGIDNLPVGKEFWPEMVGGVIFWALLFMVISSRLRQKLQLDYKRWRVIHRGLACLSLILLLIHVLFVSDSFEQTAPKVGLILSFVLVILWVVSVKFLSWWRK